MRREISGLGVQTGATIKASGVRLIADESPKIFYRNEETTLLTPVNEIAAENLIVLDGYACDVVELLPHAGPEPFTKIYINPYLEGRVTQAEFSDEAKAILRAHPVLGGLARKFDETLRVQAAGIRGETIDQVMRLAQSLARDGVDGSQDALATFFEFQSTLSAPEKENLNHYIVQLPYQMGGTQNLKFENVLSHLCIQAQQMFLWQFIVQLRPESLSAVPESVHQIARETHVDIGSNGAAPAVVNPGVGIEDDDVLGIAPMRLPTLLFAFNFDVPIIATLRFDPMQMPAEILEGARREQVSRALAEFLFISRFFQSTGFNFIGRSAAPPRFSFNFSGMDGSGRDRRGSDSSDDSIERTP